jgi:hypothetical protein
MNDTFGYPNNDCSSHSNVLVSAQNGQYDVTCVSNVVLSPHQLAKHGGHRYDIFLRKITDREQFITIDDSKIVIVPNEQLLAALANRDGKQLKIALRGSTIIDDCGSSSVGIELKSLRKTHEFGGRLPLMKALSTTNELIVVEAIEKSVSLAGPVTVRFNNYEITDVIGATHMSSSGKMRTKADICIHRSSGKNVNVSIKMEGAHYYLSGDKRLSDEFAYIIRLLQLETAPNLRVVKNADGMYDTVIGDDGSEQHVDVSFNINDRLARQAVFGEGDNVVDVLVKGDMSAYIRDGSTVSWEGVAVHTTIDDIPEDDRPVGLLRYNWGRGIMVDGIKYSGIRPAIVMASRTKSTMRI